MPALHRALVDPCDQQGSRIRCPPVAAAAAHFLGGEKFSKPERGLRRITGRGDGPVFAGGKIGDPQRAVADVGNQPPGGVGPGVCCRAQDRNLAHTGRAITIAVTGGVTTVTGGVTTVTGGVTAGACAVTGAGRAVAGPSGRASQVRRVHLSRQAEHGQPDVGVAAERDDAGGLLTGTLPARLLCLVRLSAGGAELRGIGDQAFRAAGNVQQPQAGDRIRPALRPEEDDPVPVRRDLEGSRHAQREVLGPGVLAREGIRHGLDLASAGRR